MTDPKAPSAKKDNGKQVDAKQLHVHLKEGETAGEAVARCATSPTSNATVTLHQFHPLSIVEGVMADINALQRELGKQASEIRIGDMTRPEEILVAQAHSLDTIFNALAQQAARSLVAGHIVTGENLLRMALKAQAQCRTTIEAISEIKNPSRPTFVGQQNIAQNQQVNNGPKNNGIGAHERDVTPTNELLDSSYGKRLDTRTTGTAGGSNQDLETVGTIDRTNKRGRKSSISKERL